MMRIRKLIIDAFGFSKTETNGFLILIAIVICSAILPRIYFARNHPVPSENQEAFSLWAEEIERSIKKRKQIPKEILKPSEFNPNTDNYDKLVRAGVPSLQAKRLISYRNKGGLFRAKEDLKKLYGLTDSVYARLEPHILITLQERMKPDDPKINDPVAREFIPVIQFDLNEATADELQKIRGIGPVLSERIVKYRDMLGGFHDFTQLNEVYGLKPDVVGKIVEQATLNGSIEKLTLNQTDSLKQLAKHPYINYNLARAILNYRKVHGDYSDLSELKNIKVLDDSLYHKLAPYLSL